MVLGVDYFALKNDILLKSLAGALPLSYRACEWVCEVRNSKNCVFLLNLCFQFDEKLGWKRVCSFCFVVLLLEK